jgi:hypothetical protein
LEKGILTHFKNSTLLKLAEMNRQNAESLDLSDELDVANNSLMTPRQMQWQRYQEPKEQSLPPYLRSSLHLAKVKPRNDAGLENVSEFL